MILVADDDRLVRSTLRLLLERAGYGVLLAESPDEVLAAVRAHERDLQLILMDMNYGRSTTGRDGLELLQKVKILAPTVPVILITGWGSIELAVEGMRLGAFDFITKPWDNALLLQRIRTALDMNPARHADDAPSGDFDRGGIVGSDPALESLLKTAARIAPTDAPVLILGENGTGKELIAHAIHRNSRRAANPFVMVNLGGVSRSLFESEMFGHAKGAFTGAVADRKGRFETADSGTIFLDEIGELDMDSQVKLLRVLQEHTFERLGESKPRRVDIRVISATNADLTQMVADRSFREDLFYRINLITLHLPALRERRGDIPALVNHFMTAAAENTGLPMPEISADAMQLLTRLPYRGNIRELKNIVERAMLTANGQRLEAADFGFAAVSAPVVGGTLEELERKAISETLEKYSNITDAAQALGITRQALYRKMDKYGIRR